MPSLKINDLRLKDARIRQVGLTRSVSRTHPHGIAAIIGTLNITRPKSFIPRVSDAFPILTYTRHSGSFPSAALRAPAAP